MHPYMTSAAPSSAFDGDHYDQFLAAVRAQFAEATKRSRHLFRTDAADLWAAYLDAAPAGARQVRNCSACRAFIERFGGLVTIDAKGVIASAMWPKSAPPAYLEASRALAARVEKANVVGVFVGSAAELGRARTGAWTHLAVEPPASHRWTGAVSTAGQVAAAKSQDREMLERGLAEFPVALVRKALALLASDSLFRSEKCVAVARWLVEIHERRAAAKNARLRDHITWLAVAGAPAGHCHVRSGMIGTLLEDLAADMPFAALKARFDAKMHPLHYLRPQSAPSAGNVAQAEKIVAALASAGALARRFAKLEDLKTLWLPKVAPRAPGMGGVFAHLTTRRDAPMDSPAPPAVMTWTKLAQTVLPAAEAIELFIPEGKRSYMAFVTAENPDAPPMLQWDHPDRRNPVSLYLYVSGSLPEVWNLRAGRFHRVTAAVLLPSMWDAERPQPHHGAGACLVLEGAKDTTHEAGGGMFPEWLKSEYHPVRKTLEAHFRGAKIAGKDAATGCGLCLSKGASTWDFELRVTAGGVRTRYRLDRWD